jgi:hypothetical protein
MTLGSYYRKYYKRVHCTYDLLFFLSSPFLSFPLINNFLPLGPLTLFIARRPYLGVLLKKLNG